VSFYDIIYRGILRKIIIVTSVPVKIGEIEGETVREELWILSLLDRASSW
jgi:hypothetical protein